MCIIKQICVLLYCTTHLSAQHLEVPVIRQPHPVTCLPAAATAVLQFWGAEITYGEVSTKPYIGKSGVTFFEMQEWLNAFGFQSIVCSIGTHHLSQLLTNGIPPIIALYSGVKHTVVSTGFNPVDTTFTIMDPLNGEVVFSRKRLAKEQFQAAYQAMLIFPDSINLLDILNCSKLPLGDWHMEDRKYRGETLLKKGLAQKDTLLQLTYFTRACAADSKNEVACFYQARLLVVLGKEEEAYRELRKILLRNPSYVPAVELMDRLGKK